MNILFSMNPGWFPGIVAIRIIDTGTDSGKHISDQSPGLSTTSAFYPLHVPL